MFLFPTLWLTLLGLLNGQLDTAPASGRLYYEFTQRVDQNKVKVIMLDPNGQEIKTDSPGSTIELPSSMSGTRSLLFSGGYAREEDPRDMQMSGGNINVTPGKEAKKPASPSPKPPTDIRYLDLTARTSTTVTTIGGVDYAAPSQPVPAPPAAWRDLPQTRKIAGFLCHKATAAFERETYTLWITTELPFTYSPIPELTPKQGVVLALSSDQQEFTATKLTVAAVSQAEVRPSQQARSITEAELKELRAKDQADSRHRLLEQYTTPAGH
jgi:GLPGLI family protein